MMRQFRRRLQGKGVLRGENDTTLAGYMGVYIESNAPGGTLLRHFRYATNITTSVQLLVKFFDTDSLDLPSGIPWTIEEHDNLGNAIGVGDVLNYSDSAFLDATQFTNTFGVTTLDLVQLAPNYVGPSDSHWNMEWEIWLPYNRTMLLCPNVAKGSTTIQKFSVEAYDLEGSNPTE